MNRTALLKKIRTAAKLVGKPYDLTHGGDHDRCRVGNTMVPIPRHSEINEHTARGICVDLENELGEDWWR